MSSYTGDNSPNSLKPFILVATLLFALMGAIVWYMSTLEHPYLGLDKPAQQDTTHQTSTTNANVPQ